MERVVEVQEEVTKLDDNIGVLTQTCNHQCRPRIIGTGYYDGVVSGILQCTRCGAEYLFKMIDVEEIEPFEDIRVSALFPLPDGSLEKYNSIFPSERSRSWPVWLPRWQFDSQQAEQAAREKSNRIKAEAGPAEWVICWCAAGWEKTISESRKLSAEDLPDVMASMEHPWPPHRGRDWFEFLGLERTGEKRS